jgi:hypothetical protein
MNKNKNSLLFSFLNILANNFLPIIRALADPLIISVCQRYEFKGGVLLYIKGMQFFKVKPSGPEHTLLN